MAALKSVILSGAQAALDALTERGFSLRDREHICNKLVLYIYRPINNEFVKLPLNTMCDDLVDGAMSRFGLGFLVLELVSFNTECVSTEKPGRVYFKKTLGELISPGEALLNNGSFVE